MFIREIHFISSLITFLFVGILVTIKINLFHFFFNKRNIFVFLWRYIRKHFFLISLLLLYRWDSHTLSLLIFDFPLTSLLHLTQTPCITSGRVIPNFCHFWYKIRKAPESHLYLCQKWRWNSQELDTATQVQILDKTDCISHSTNTLRKGMNPIILPPAMGK